MTVGISNKNFSCNSEDNLLNLKGDIAAVMHQYDRKSKIVKKKFINIPDNIIANKNNEEDYIYTIYIIIIAFIIIFFIQKIYLKLKELKKIDKKKEKSKGYKEVNILK